MMTLPLAIGGICIITSIIGTFFVKLGPSQSIMGALYEGLIATGILSLIGVAAAINWLIGFGELDGRRLHRHIAVLVRRGRSGRHRA